MGTQRRNLPQTGFFGRRCTFLSLVPYLFSICIYFRFFLFQIWTLFLSVSVSVSRSVSRCPPPPPPPPPPPFSLSQAQRQLMMVPLDRSVVDSRRDSVTLDGHGVCFPLLPSRPFRIDRYVCLRMFAVFKLLFFWFCSKGQGPTQLNT